MVRIKSLYILLIFCFGLILFSSCAQSDNNRSILPTDISLQCGDIVYRRGRGPVSTAVVAADISGKYSHIGLVTATDSGIMIVHAVPYEPDFPGDQDRVKVERPESFFSSKKAGCGAVQRVLDSIASRKAAAYALEAYKRGILFDHDFNDADSTSLYCCELVNRAYLYAGIELVGNIYHYLSFPGLIDAKCLLPSDFYDSDKTITIATF